MNNEILNQNTDGNESLTLENARKTRNVSKNKKSIGQNNSEKRDRLDEDDILANVIRPSIPKESEITSAKFEGPNISLYTLNPKFSLTELT